MWSFCIIQYHTISLQCKDKTLRSHARGKVLMSISLRMELPLCPDPGLEVLRQVYSPEQTSHSLLLSPCYPRCPGSHKCFVLDVAPQEQPCLSIIGGLCTYLAERWWFFGFRCVGVGFFAFEVRCALSSLNYIYCTSHENS